MSLLDSIPFVNRDPYGKLAKQLGKLRGDADALALFPYDDGTFFLKPAEFDKSLIGGQGGYETPDGDKIVLDGNGEAVRSLLGIDVVLACDPTEHAGAVEPMKAAIAHKHEIGEWIKVDKKGNVLAVGEALDQVGDDIDVGLEGSLVEETALEKEMTMDAALAQLEAEGEVTKLYDLAPPAAPKLVEETTRTTAVATDGAGVDVDSGTAGGLFDGLSPFGSDDARESGDVENELDEPPQPVETTETTEHTVTLEEATHIAVDQSKAANLMPTTTSTTELNTALDKARMEEYEEGRLVTYFVYGLIAGIIAGIVMAVVMAGLFTVF